jgi:hypothetical protein
MRAELDGELRPSSSAPTGESNSESVDGPADFSAEFARVGQAATCSPPPSEPLPEKALLAGSAFRPRPHGPAD